MTDTILELVTAEIKRQDSILPSDECYPPNRNGIRLGLAALQDELDEAHEAWHIEKKLDTWEKTKEELIQAISVGIRIITNLP